MINVDEIHFQVERGNVHLDCVVERNKFLTIMPMNGDRFLFKHSDPKLVAEIADAMKEATAYAQDISFASVERVEKAAK